MGVDNPTPDAPNGTRAVASPMFRSIRARLMVGGLLTVSLPLAAFAVLIGSVLWRFYLQQMEAELATQARVIAEQVAPALADAARTPAASVSALAVEARRWERLSNSRVTIADVEGVVRASSSDEGVGEAIDDARRPGLRDAARGRANATVWKSPNFDYEDTMYINAPVRHGGRVVGAVRVAHSLAQIQRNIGRVRTTLLAAVLAYAAVLAGLTVGLAGGIVRPIEVLQRGATRIAAGDLAHRVAVAGGDEIARLAETLNQMTARLEVLENLRRRYVSDVSHELRTPIAAIRTMAETLLQYGDSDPELCRRYLPRVVAQTERLARLAGQILDLALVESGNLLGALAPVPLAGVLQEVSQTQAERAATREVELTVNVPHLLPPVLGDRDRLIQVFLNLTDNALRHTPPGGRVTIAAHLNGDRVEASVEDTGEGIVPANLPHIFERFYRVDKARSMRSGGAGLGLAIVRQVVEAHGGVIDVASTPGVGTRFRIELPCVVPEGRASLPPPSPDAEPHP
ncbi:MAG: ATP-binding protein [Polyangiales bacterium]